MKPDSNIFKYWENNSEYLRLKNIPLKYLCTSSRIIFSTSELIVDIKRNRLNPSKMEYWYSSTKIYKNK